MPLSFTHLVASLSLLHLSFYPISLGVSLPSPCVDPAWGQPSSLVVSSFPTSAPAHQRKDVFPERAPQPPALSPETTAGSLGGGEWQRVSQPGKPWARGRRSSCEFKAAGEKLIRLPVALGRAERQLPPRPASGCERWGLNGALGPQPKSEQRDGKVWRGCE